MARLSPPISVLMGKFPQGRTFYLDVTKAHNEEHTWCFPDNEWAIPFIISRFPSVSRLYTLPWTRFPRVVIAVVVKSADEFMVDALTNDSAVYQFTEENFNQVCDVCDVSNYYSSAYLSHLHFISKGLVAL